MAKRPTILDVAKAAGVSKSTVSLVVRGSPVVKDSTRQAVRQAMADLGYVYNRSAARMRSDSSGLIGLVINDLRNPFFTEFAASLQMTLAEQGYATVIANTAEDPELQNRTIASLGEHGLSGLILSPAYGKEAETAAALARAAVPTIQVFRRLDMLGDAVPFIAPDYETGSALATTHLLEQGCRRIAFLGGLPERQVTRERMSAYLSVLRARGFAPLVINGETSRAFGRAMLDRLIGPQMHADGILCFNDLVALGVLSACAERGQPVGASLRVIGIDDIEACRDSFPPLSSVSCGIPDLATTAATRLLAWINDAKRPEPLLRTPVTLVRRASSTAA